MKKGKNTRKGKKKERHGGKGKEGYFYFFPFRCADSTNRVNKKAQNNKISAYIIKFSTQVEQQTSEREPPAGGVIDGKR